MGGRAGTGCGSSCKQVLRTSLPNPLPEEWRVTHGQHARASHRGSPRPPGCLPAAAQGQAAGAGPRAGRRARGAGPPGRGGAAERRRVCRDVCALEVAAEQVGAAPHRGGEHARAGGGAPRGRAAILAQTAGRRLAVSRPAVGHSCAAGGPPPAPPCCPAPPRRSCTTGG